MRQKQQFDIWYAYFYYEDMPTKGKRRPVLVLGRDGPDLRVAMITSKLKIRSSKDFELKDWQDEGLTKPSLLRLSRIISLNEAFFGRYLGKLSPQDQATAESKITGKPMLESLQTGIFEYEKLKPEEMQRRGILGRLYGVMADTVNPTRNGRAYSAKLWENVFNNPIMQERIENKCCFGELGHPIDREETDMEKIAICMDGLPKKDKDGKLQAVFNILDTPNGRILKTLCDYGCNIGISSRGSGDLIEDFDGNESVDPDTYNCEGWDAVLIPAVKEARLKYVTESLDKTRYKKSLRTRLQESVNSAEADKKQCMKESLHLFLGEDLWDEIENDVTSPEAGPEPNEDFVDNLDASLDDTNTDNFDATENMMDDDFVEGEESSGEDVSDNLDDIFADTDDEVSDSNELNDIFAEDEPLSNNFEYKGIKVVEDPNSGKFVLELDQNTYVFNSAKNAKIWIDMNTDAVQKTIQNQQENEVEDKIRDLQTKSVEEESEDELTGSEENSMHESLVEEQIGRDTHKEDKSVSEVQEPEKEEDSETEDKDEEDSDNITISLSESVSYPSSGEERVADFVLNYLDENPNDINQLDLVISYMTELDNQYQNEKIDPEIIKNIIKDKINFDNKMLNYGAEEADNIGETVDNLYEMLEKNLDLEKRVLSLQEKLSAGNARETKLSEDLALYKIKVMKLSQVSKENKALKEKLNKLEGSSKQLNESVTKSAKSVKVLNERLQKLTEEKNSVNNELKTLQENYAELEKDSAQIKEHFTKKVEKQNKLLEKYQKITKNAVNRYINLQATNLGVKSTEIRNRLPEQFSFSDVDSICEELRDYKLNISRLPFNANRPLNESHVRINNLSKGLIPENELDDLNDYDMKLMGAIK